MPVTAARSGTNWMNSPAFAPGQLPRTTVADDMAMLRAAAELTRDIAAARAGLYWPDMLLSAAVGYGALAGAIVLGGWAALACALVAATTPPDTSARCAARR